MKVITTTGVFLISLFLFAGHATTSELAIGRMRAAIWPEYDDPGVLVIYDGRFKDQGTFPTEATFLLPKGAVVSDACSLSPKGTHFCQLYKQKNTGDVDEITMKLPYPNFYLSFHINPFGGKSDEKGFIYTVKTSHAVEKLEVDIQRPLRSEAFSITPASTDTSEKKGFEHYAYVFESVEKGKALDFRIEYMKKDNIPSVDIKYSPMSGQQTQAVQPQSRMNIALMLSVVGTIGLVIVIGLLWFVFKRK